MLSASTCGQLLKDDVKEDRRLFASFPFLKLGAQRMSQL